jgi:DNA recombination protein RmuC
MDNPALILIAAIGGFLFGALLIYLVHGRAVSARLAATSAELAAAKSQAEAAQREREGIIAARAKAETAASRVPGLEAQAESLRSELDAANAHRSSLEATLKAERADHKARVEELERIDKQLRESFVALASDALGKNSDRFLELVSERFRQHNQAAQQSLAEREKAVEALVKPLQESLAKFETQVGQVELARQDSYSALRTQIQQIAQGQDALRTETGRLVQALRSPKTRGRWGELQLRNVLELAGMTPNVDFVEQSVIPNDEGALRPDAIVRLPGGKCIIVDAKTPLDAYLNAIESDGAAKTQFLDQHARQLRAHAKALGEKEYWRRLPKTLPATPDFVVMFVPGEAFYAAAVEADPKVFEEAFKSRVMIATPMTLLALMKVVAYGWQQELLAKHAQEVADLGKEIYARIGVFGRHVADLGKALRKSVDAYNEAIGSLEGRILPTARRFEQVGIAPAHERLPELAQVTEEPRRLTAPEFSAAQSPSP